MNKNLIITTISLCTIILILSAFLATTNITTTNNINTLTTTLNTQADQITQLNQNLTNKITQSNQNLTNQIFQLTQNIANQLTQINQLNAIITDQKNTITAYNHTLTQLQQQQNQSFTSIADQQSTLNAYNQTMTNYQQQTIQNLTNLTQNLTSLDTQITDLNTRLPIEQYDYIIYIPTNTTGFYVAKNGQTGQNEFTSTDAASTINYALSKGKSIYVLSGTYLLSSDVLCYNKKNVVIDGEWATLRCVNHKIVIRGSSCLDSQDNRISGFTIIGGTVRIENSYKTEISNMIFQLCPVAIELANTDTWTECTKIDNVSFTM
jgi:hypothetical protein